MPSPVRLYQEEMHGNLGFFATWLPGDPIAVGDVGVLLDGRFRKATSLDELGIDFQTTDGDSRQNVQYTSTRGTKVETSAGANVTGLVESDIKVEFSHTGAFVFQASSIVQRTIANRLSVGERLVQSFERRQWKEEWLLVEAVYATPRATIIVSEDSSAGLTLKATANTPVPGISLADPRIGLTVTSARGKLVHILGAKDLHPLYSCLRVKKPLFGSPSVQPVRGPGTDAATARTARPAITELLDS